MMPVPALGSAGGFLPMAPAQPTPSEKEKEKEKEKENLGNPANVGNDGAKNGYHQKQTENTKLLASYSTVNAVFPSYIAPRPKRTRDTAKVRPLNSFIAFRSTFTAEFLKVNH
jgi:hypothetical protein